VHRHEVEDGGRVALGGRRRAPPLSLGRPVQAELDREGRGGHKGGDDYYSTIIDETVEPLRRLKECADAHKADRALTGERGGKLNYTLWRKHLDKARKTSGVSYTDHPLRHVSASLMWAGGATIDEVMHQMGHKTNAVTKGLAACVQDGPVRAGQEAAHADHRRRGRRLH